MTDKIYERDSYKTELSTVVTDCFEEDGKVYIKLKETIFFPEEGGQYADKGTLVCDNREINIINGELIGSASEAETDIRYEVEDKIESGTEVLCKLDWATRFDRMQNHSGEHILSGLIHNTYGYDNIGFHLSDDEAVTLVVSGILDATQVRELEKQANMIVYRNLPITDSYPSKDELKDIDYRSKIDIAGQVRLITIGDKDETIDICACCAPHVKLTGAIGIIKIISFMKFKGGTQLGILCGRRALEYIEHNIDNLELVARGFSTHADNVPKLVENLKEENMRLNSKVAELTEKIIIENIKSGVYDKCVFTDMDLSAANMKNIYNEFISLREGFVGLFVGDDENGYRYYAGGKDVDAKTLADEMNKKLSAKGGGSSQMIQGRLVSKREDIEAFWKSI
ncbi:MAG: alanyl-tRNA editing protein [Lachnospiraceae bacterium]|nr:alanyl-tRNA editing protein [Lachnospiraceae bacterium]